MIDLSNALGGRHWIDGRSEDLSILEEGFRSISCLTAEMLRPAIVAYLRASKKTGPDLDHLVYRRSMEEENRKLKCIVADLTLDKHMLEEVLRKKV